MNKHLLHLPDVAALRGLVRARGVRQRKPISDSAIEKAASTPPRALDAGMRLRSSGGSSRNRPSCIEGQLDVTISRRVLKFWGTAWPTTSCYGRASNWCWSTIMPPDRVEQSIRIRLRRACQVFQQKRQAVFTRRPGHCAAPTQWQTLTCVIRDLRSLGSPASPADARKLIDRPAAPGELNADNADRTIHDDSRAHTCARTTCLRILSDTAAAIWCSWLTRGWPSSKRAS